MAALTKDQRKLKIIALYSAFSTLKEKSIGSKNHASQEGVVDLANSSTESEYFTSNISYSSLKQPKNPEMIKLKSEIDLFKIEHKRGKNILTNKNKDKLDEFNLIIYNNTSEKAQLCLRIENLETEVEQKDKRIDNLKTEVEILNKKLKRR